MVFGSLKPRYLGPWTLSAMYSGVLRAGIVNGDVDPWLLCDGKSVEGLGYRLSPVFRV